MKRFSCEEAVELVTAFLEGALDEPTRYRFEEHLGGCEGCERYLGQLRATVEALGRLRTAETAETPQAAESTETTGATPGPARPGGLPESTRDRLLAAFRDRRRT
ncbi:MULTISPECIES: zf-HC2 domain-containing protein [unclassified Streptosporangium]|uniref:zf-HC2 domain-containing protein n=1 Tax=unclassified Streptosporangium TaxID=2632669 RepID=UPI002E27C04B|nr:MULTISPECIES: zf-HC2 domain-containing protein [unclassified Streptosporangium]